jgi:hypothetical protein
MRKASPASLIAPYYGEDFFRELFRANEANKALHEATSKKSSAEDPGLKPATYSRMYEEVPVMVGGPGLKRADYSFEGLKKNAELLRAYPWLEGLPSVVTYGKEASAAKGPKTKTARARALRWGEKYMARNSLTADRPLPSPRDTAEHELTHHAMRPYFGRSRDMWGYRVESMPEDVAEIGELEIKFAPVTGEDRTPLKIKDIHESRPAEFMGSLGRLQRETFQATGSRLKPGEFAKLVASGETPKYLTQEGQRMITYSRNVLESIEKSGEGFKGEAKTWKKAKRDKSKRLKKTFLDRIEQILPTVVKADRIPGEMRLG